MNEAFISDWYGALSQKLQDQELTYVVIIMWCIWRERNKFVMAQKDQLPAVVVSEMIKFYHEVQPFVSNTEDGEVQEQVTKVWEAPPEDVVKVNVDATLNALSGVLDFGYAV
ncbi:hypothetical protein P3X46_001663 [Hevea brasiliensis]|uniref:Uncharacterized protein n=1 Tax=Hevea brasiliensis TaxID=3981 RepID=A0ABQ9NGZ3_HEVBR|nr:hypothetical protein P3X46_001663 [Hevea brasiliensis]